MRGWAAHRAAPTAARQRQATSDDPTDAAGPGGFTGVLERFAYPRLYNLYLDPKEQHNYLTRKLADVAQNVIINQIDCGTLNGIPKTTIYKGETVEVELKDMIVGRTARDTVRNPITDETIVAENQIITNEIADKLKELKLESIRVRSPLTCESPRGICARCYGIDMSTNQLVEEGLAALAIVLDDRRVGLGEIALGVLDAVCVADRKGDRVAFDIKAGVADTRVAQRVADAVGDRIEPLALRRFDIDLQQQIRAAAQIEAEGDLLLRDESRQSVELRGREQVGEAQKHAQQTHPADQQNLPVGEIQH